MKLKIAGILNMVVGALAVLFALAMLVAGITTLNVPGGGAVFVIVAIIFATMGIPAVVGGIWALRRKRKQLVITCSLFLTPLWGIGILTAFLVAVSNKEFTQIEQAMGSRDDIF